MNKQEENPSVTDDGRSAEAVSVSVARTGLKITHWVAFISFCLSAAGWVILSRYSDETTWLAIDGTLHEPLFWIIPVSFFLLFISLFLFFTELLMVIFKKI
jgi:hypothetical protein